MKDRELIHRIQNGRKEYLNDIAAKYYDDIYYFCCYQIGSREDAYDLAQDTFLRFIRYVDSYRYQNLKGYLLTIAMNLCRNYMRERAKPYEAWDEEEYNLSCNKVEGGNVIANEGVTGQDGAEDSILLAQALQRLPDKQREAVLLHHFYGYKNREIAQMTGASYAAVKSRVKQGLEKLNQLLDKEDFYG